MKLINKIMSTTGLKSLDSFALSEIIVSDIHVLLNNYL